MKDALANLQKLPAKCYAVMNDEVVVIRRGAKEPAPFSLAKDQVVHQNLMLGVTNEEQLAMIAGVTFGWDADAADPETHRKVTDPDAPEGPFTYRYAAEIPVEIVAEAYSEEQAAEMAKCQLEWVVKYLTDADPNPGQVMGNSMPDSMDLIESDDPREE